MLIHVVIVVETSMQLGLFPPHDSRFLLDEMGVELVHQADHVCTYDQILKEVWSDPESGSVDLIQVYISRLRKKIESNPKNPQYLVTEHGAGYRFVSKMTRE